MDTLTMWKGEKKFLNSLNKYNNKKLQGFWTFEELQHKVQQQQVAIQITTQKIEKRESRIRYDKT